MALNGEKLDLENFLKSIESHYVDDIQPSLGLAGSFELCCIIPKENRLYFLICFLEMVHNKNKHSKLSAKPSDSWISSDL